MSFTSPNEPTLDMFIPIVESVMEEVNSLLAIGQSTNPYIETWNPLLVLGGWVNNLCRGALRHLLEDLICFPQNIEKLRTFWSTRRFAQMANFKLQIRTLNGKTYGAPLGPWPSNLQDWKEVYEHFPLKRGYRFVGTEDAHDFSHTPTDPSELIVHPELKIATYLHLLSHNLAENESSSNSTPPFTYISASNLPCLPCARWMSKLNSMDLKHGVTFRGSTSKWPNDWRMPALKAAEISEDIEEWAWYDYLRAQSRESVVNVIA
ncbi:hypothetical protein GALMADRAFT_213500 [Galerina marginata CBS 339.88]|uniref:Uncharacterized protein n=1 Tax=Galerina marginata (strain CBS 339.88) TaxID=685588 RepID=A0A067SMC0_GALM3|nr:hypothetical protein GALMADRAFT_213500 [Galerina marginata CBS 339.88]